MPAPTVTLRWDADAESWVVEVIAAPETDVIVTLNGTAL